MTSAVDFESVLLKTLRDDEPLAAIVGKKIYAMQIPQGTKLPCVSFQRIAGIPANTLSGFSGLEKIIVQIDAWAQSLSQAKAISKAVRAAMPQYGPWGAHLDTDADLFESGTNYYRVTQSWTVWFCENAED